MLQADATAADPLREEQNEAPVRSSVAPKGVRCAPAAQADLIVADSHQDVPHLSAPARASVRLLAVDLDRAGSPVAPKPGDHCVPLEDWAAQTPDGCSGPTVQDDLVVPKAGRSGRVEYSALAGCWVPHDCSAPADLAEAGSAARMAAGRSVPAARSAPAGCWVPHGYSVLVDLAEADSVVPMAAGHSAPEERSAPVGCWVPDDYSED